MSPEVVASDADLHRLVARAGSEAHPGSRTGPGAIRKIRREVVFHGYQAPLALGQPALRLGIGAQQVVDTTIAIDTESKSIAEIRCHADAGTATWGELV